MRIIESDFEQLQERVAAASARVAALLRTGIDGEAPVPGLQWTAADCAAHLVSSQRAFTRYARGEPALAATVDELAAVNEARIDEVAERDPARLADLLDAATHAFLEETSQRAGEQSVAWYQREVSYDLASTTGLLLGELVLHGLDIARSAGRPWPVARTDAVLAITGVLPLLPVYVDAGAADGLTARYALRLRGGPKVGLAFADGALRVEAPPEGPVDCHLSADPATYLLVGYGRQSQWPAILTGRLVAWGRKPWLSLRFANLFKRP